MNLSVLDRLLLLNVLPAEGSATTIRIVHQLRQDLSFSEAEHATLSLTQEGGVVRWDQAAATDKAVEIGPKAHGILADALRTLSDTKKLGVQYLDLYDRFVE